MSALPEGALPSAADKSAFQRSTIQIIIPESLPPLPEDIHNVADIDELAAKQRTSFFYDEITSFLIVLRAPLPPQALTTCLPYLNASITAHLAAFPAHASATPQIPPEDPPIKLTLDSVSKSHPELVTLNEQSPHSSTAVFRTELYLRHPERLLSRPALYFAASVFLKTPPAPPLNPLDDYLPSGSPLSSNVLAPLLSTPSFAAAGINLPSSRLEKVMPYIASSNHDIRPLRATTPISRIAPALLLRTSRTLFPDIVYLTLDVQVPTAPPTAVRIQTLDAQIPNLSITPLTTIPVPTTMNPGDRTAFVFQSDTRASSAQATFSITAVAQLDNTTTRSLRINRVLHAPSARIPPRDRPKHWSISKPARTSTTSDALSDSKPSGGDLKLSLSGPKRIRPNEPFYLHLSILNLATRKRRLHVLGPAPRPQTKTSWAVSASAERSAPAVLDQRDLGSLVRPERRRSVRQLRSGRVEVLPLKVEVKAGVLAPGSCREIRLGMRAVGGEGVVSVEGIVVVDVDSRETCVVGEGWEVLCYDSDSDCDPEEAQTSI
ncbi:hypothetical protein ANO11243_042980 [Dothideomycetidae sp. 11243]|nr:hypothetical protein ANO11243_042980 [fungal sp. No.11243]